MMVGIINVSWALGVKEGMWMVTDERYSTRGTERGQDYVCERCCEVDS